MDESGLDVCVADSVQVIAIRITGIDRILRKKRQVGAQGQLPLRGKINRTDPRDKQKSLATVRIVPLTLPLPGAVLYWYINWKKFWCVRARKSSPGPAASAPGGGS